MRLRMLHATLVMAAALAIALPVAAAARTVISGTAAYHERVAPGAVFDAELRETHRPGTPGEVIARTHIGNPGPSPIAFTIRYNRRQIRQGWTYVVRATLRAGGRPRLAGHDAPVLTHGHGNRVAILLEPVR